MTDIISNLNFVFVMSKKPKRKALKGPDYWPIANPFEDLKMGEDFPCYW